MIDRRFAGRDPFFSFPGLDAYCRGIYLIRGAQSCFLACLLFGRSRGAGGYDGPASPHSEEEHPEKEAEGGQSYPGDTAQGEVKSKMLGWRFRSGRRCFFTWRHLELRYFNCIEQREYV